MVKTNVIRIHQPGGPEAMRWEEIELPSLKPTEILIRQEAIGVNFIDTYHRSGLYPVALPFTLGVEAAGVIQDVGSAVSKSRIGARVAYASDLGAYAEYKIMEEAKVIALPDFIDTNIAAALLSKGMTAEYLIRRTYRVQAGDKVLLHAATGGVGTIATQWLCALGAIVIGTVGGPAKMERAKALGCHYVIDYREEDWVKQVRDATGGSGVDVVYDGVGADVFLKSLDCLRPRGMMVTFGNASGPVAPIEPLLLSRKGSLYLTRPTLAHYISASAEMQQSAKDVFDMVRAKKITVEISARYPLAEAAKAHRDLHDRKILGSALLIP